MTSIEWLEMEIVKLEAKFAIPHAIYELCEQAKERHKAEHEETFKQSRMAKIFEKDMPPVYENFEQYYNKTFKKD